MRVRWRITIEPGGGAFHDIQLELDGPHERDTDQNLTVTLPSSTGINSGNARAVVRIVGGQSPGDRELHLADESQPRRKGESLYYYLDKRKLIFPMRAIGQLPAIDQAQVTIAATFYQSGVGQAKSGRVTEFRMESTIASRVLRSPHTDLRINLPPIRSNSWSRICRLVARLRPSGCGLYRVDSVPVAEVTTNIQRNHSGSGAVTVERDGEICVGFTYRPALTLRDPLFWVLGAAITVGLGVIANAIWAAIRKDGP